MAIHKNSAEMVLYIHVVLRMPYTRQIHELNDFTSVPPHPGESPSQKRPRSLLGHLESLSSNCLRLVGGFMAERASHTEYVVLLGLEKVLVDALRI